MGKKEEEEEKKGEGGRRGRAGARINDPFLQPKETKKKFFN